VAARLSASAPAGRPPWWTEAIAAVRQADPVMHGLVHAFPDIHLVSRGDPFATLARSIVGQQISVKAAQSVWNRFCAAAGSISPEAVLARPASALRAAGLSERKVEYICDLARRFDQGTVRPERWGGMDDEAVIGELAAVRGIGRWTAEMFLMFNLLRPDVLPLDDIGLLRGVGVYYGDGERADRKLAQEVAECWRPWRSVGTWYLWRALDPVPVEY
jgi:DNA-3-methyladenine glycosylase II